MFINKFEREHYLFLIGTYSFLNEWVGAEKNSLNKDERKWLKTAGTYLKKSLAGFINRIDEDQRKRLMRQAKNYYVALLPTRSEAPEEQALVKTELVYDLSTYTLYNMCQSREKACAYTDNNYKECELFHILLDLNIPLCNEDGEGCPYKITWEV